MSNHPRKTLSPMRGNASISFYRRLLVAYLIEHGVNSVPKITAATGFQRRRIQDLILSLADMDIDVEFIGAPKNGGYVIHSWSAINMQWVKENLDMICEDILDIKLKI